MATFFTTISLDPEGNTTLVFCVISAALKYTVADFTLAEVKIGFCANDIAETKRVKIRIIFLLLSIFNVFLTREKTLSRKLEEILLVYLLENNRITSKKRMLEVYFNVIEWGPNVYGIGEASAFYFQKKPLELTLNECLFLASIVPKPKKFMSLFDEEGKLKSFANNREEFIKKLMMQRGLIIPEDTIGQHIPIFISGPARTLMKFKVNDSIRVDSLFTDFN